MSTLDALKAFQWSRQPGAEQFVRQIVDRFLAQNPFAANLAQRMYDESGTRFVDWIDYLALPQTPAVEEQLLDNGFEVESAIDGTRTFRNPHGVFPRVTLSALPTLQIALKVDSVADFLAVHQLEVSIEGEPYAPVRRAVVSDGQGTSLAVVERHGSWQFKPPYTDPAARILAAVAEEPRVVVTVQKGQQDLLGLGWGNHDHHTYRSSRASFAQMIAFFEKLGLECRERFYAGREAGWGAQVMENTSAGIVVFADVDLSPDELLEDFSHQPLAPRDQLGTVGLWCGLHGEAFLQAGMHHLECQFDFEALSKRLKQHHGINVMKPFTDYPFLRQAFTEGERWPVSEARIQNLLASRLITPDQAAQFRQNGAIGSHLENLERNEGYKGFNQKGVSEIISATDPRKQVVGTAH